MSHLLDTHALLWFVAGSKSLGKTTRSLIERNPAVYYSPISIAELRLKDAKGRLQLPNDLPQLIEAQGIPPLDYQVAHADEISRFGSLVNHDPFDRMILAQASATGLKLITADSRLLSLGFSWVINARK